MKKKLVVVGGGAAGFFCAINAAMQAQNLQVILLEKTGKLLSKVKVSGGGRCNVTHHNFDLDTLVKSYPRGEKFLKKAFHWFNTKDTITWFKEHGIELHTEADNRMFPTTNSSQTIITCFEQAAEKLGIEIHTHIEVANIIPATQSESYQLQLTNGQVIDADFICLATGGWGQKIPNYIQQLQLQYQQPVPSLFTFNTPKHSITHLMGISMPKVMVKINQTKWSFIGDILITHWGFSGPAVLKLSAIAARWLAEKQYHFDISINWLGEEAVANAQHKLQIFRNVHGAKKVFASKLYPIPNRLWYYFLQEASITEATNYASLTAAQGKKLLQLLTQFDVKVEGKTTFKEEFVTCGGVDLQEIDVNSMSCKKYPNLYCCGEMLDIDGITGGFNFQNAWTTAFIAAKHIAKRCNV